jgi:type II secretory pathway component GspD/PulD (secretin)
MRSTVKRSAHGPAKLGLRAWMVVAAATLGVSVSPLLAAEGATVDSAAQLLEQGRVVEAKALLVSLRKSVGDGADRDRIVELIAAADRRLRFMDEAELSLQKAEVAVNEGELRVAENQANAVKRSKKSTDAQKSRADELIARAQQTRQELEQTAPSTLAQAISDFNAGRYPEAKAGFASLMRTGVALNQDQLAELNKHQDRIYELERQNGRSFDAQVIPMSVMGGATRAVAAAAPAIPQDGASGEPAAAPAPAGDSLFDQARRFDAERLMLEAEEAYKAGRYNDAVQKLTEVTTVFSTSLTAEEAQKASDRLAEAKALLGAGGDAADTVVRQRTIMAEEATAVFDNLITEANAALGRGDVQSARNLAAQARLTWNNAQANGVFSDEQYRARLAEVDGLLKKIDTTSEQIARDEVSRRQSELRSEESRTRQQQQEERATRIRENLDRLRTLQAEQKYEEALQVVDQVLFLDPTNPAALLLKDVLRDVVLYREVEKTRRERALSYGKEFSELEKSLIVPDQIMSYPPDWPELSFRRGEVQSFVESDADRKVLATLETRRIPASFRDNTLEDIVTFVATVTNLNVDVDWDSLSAIGIERDKQITLELREVPARVVLDRVLEKAQPDQFSRAGWAVNDGVLVVAAEEALRRNKFIVIYDIRDLLFQIPDFANAPELDLDQVLNQAGQQGGGGGGGSVFGDTEDGPLGGPSEEELTDQILEIIQTNVDFQGWRDNGGDTGVVQVLNGNLIITNTARNHRDIQSLLTQLREIRSVQINVESRFLTVSSDFFEQIGFDLDVFFNAENDQVKAAERQVRAFSGLGSLANEGLNLYPSDVTPLGGARSGTAGGYQVVPGSEAAVGGPQYEFGNTQYSIPAPSPLSVIPAQQGSANIVDTATNASATGFAATVLSAAPALQVAGTFLNDVQVDFLIEATQADRRNVLLNAPRITFSNGRTANISVVNQVGFVSDLTPIVGQGSVAFDPTIGRINSGFSLLVRGVVSADRRYVTMIVRAAVSGRPRFTSQSVTAQAAGQGQGNAQGQIVTASFQVPELDVTRVETGVTVPDRGTVLLGGQRVSSEVEIEAGVPVLSKIPIINRFFTNRSEIRADQTLLVLMKPTIIIQNEEEEKAFPGLIEKLRNPY